MSSVQPLTNTVAHRFTRGVEFFCQPLARYIYGMARKHPYCFASYIVFSSLNACTLLCPLMAIGVVALGATVYANAVCD